VYPSGQPTTAQAIVRCWAGRVGYDPCRRGRLIAGRQAGKR